MVDACPIDGSDPIENVKVIRAELAGHSAELGSRPEILVANKADLPESAEGVARLREAYGEVTTISAATGKGVKELLAKLFARLLPPRD